MKIYSPAQVTVGTFLGGPLAMIYVLKKNFDSLGKKDAARTTLIWGSLFIVTMVVIAPLLPDDFPNFALPFGYCFAARMIAEKYQLTKGAIETSGAYAFQSNWKVFGVALGFLIAFLALVAVWAGVLQGISAT